MNTLPNYLRNTKYLLITLLLMSLSSMGQIVFEKGYFINDGGQKTDCFIKNLDWAKEPSSIKYKLVEDGEVNIARIDSITEFGIIDDSQFNRFNVIVDRGNAINGSLEVYDERSPEEETVFLKVIIEGNASLYEALSHKIYFYSVNDSDVKQLIYKRYIVNSNVATDNRFVSQLYEDLKSPQMTINDFQKIQYNATDLIRFFEKYNSNLDEESINYQLKQKRKVFNLRLKPGIRYISFSLKNGASNLYVDFEDGIKPSLGIEAEFIFPWNKNKWSFIMEPTYQYYKGKDLDPVYSFEANYQSLELPIGIKYSVFFNKKSKIFLVGGFVMVDIPFDSKVGSLDVNSTSNIILGCGYEYNNKLGIEFRYGSNRIIFADYAYYSNKYKTYSIVLGYNLF